LWPVKCRIDPLLKKGTEDPSHGQASNGQAFHSRSLHVLHRDSNLRVLVDVSLGPAGGEATEIEQ